MSNYKQSLYKSLENLDELYDVIFDAYRGGIVLHYCFKCFTTFLTIEEREEHDETHKKQCNSDYFQNQNNLIEPVDIVEYNEFGFQANNTNFVKTDHLNSITKCYVCCKQFSSIETQFVHLQTHFNLSISKCTIGYKKAINVG